MPKPRYHSHTWEPSPYAHTQPLPLACETDLVNPFLLVSDVMTTDFRSCAPWDRISDAAEVFHVSQCGFIPVVETVRPVGVLTDLDVALAIHRYGEEVFKLFIRDIMSSPVVTIKSCVGLDVLIRKLGEHGLRRLPVVDHEQRIQGVVSVSDLVAFIPERGVGRTVCEIVRGRTARSTRYQRILSQTEPSPGRAPQQEVRPARTKEPACTA